MGPICSGALGRVSQTNHLPFPQQVCAKRRHAIRGLQPALDQGLIVAQLLDGNRRPAGFERLTADHPYAGSGAGIEQRPQRNLKTSRDAGRA